jgi:hypothetical protein
MTTLYEKEANLRASPASGRHDTEAGVNVLA